METLFFIIHNLIAHPLLLTGSKWADRFHDWTAEKIESEFSIWEYGTCNDRPARKHKIKGNVQFILWNKGEQGHSEDFWINFDSSYWDSFIKSANLKMKPEDMIKRGTGNYFHCTDYEDAVKAIYKYHNQFKTK